MIQERYDFPYITDHNFVVFGGHDTWLASMKKLLPNVLFIDRKIPPKSQLVQGKDAVWVQTNSISHGSYYKVVNISKAQDIPINYFNYASPKKCATQLIDFDSNLST